MTQLATQQLATPEEFAGRIFEAAVGGMEVLSIYLGEKLGYYTGHSRLDPPLPASLRRVRERMRGRLGWGGTAAGGTLIPRSGNPATAKQVSLNCRIHCIVAVVAWLCWATEDDWSRQACLVTFR